MENILFYTITIYVNQMEANNENPTYTDKLYKDHSWWVIISANMGLIAYAGSTSFIDSWNYFFLSSYTSVGIEFLLVIQVVYLIWDMVNDPLFGYFSDKHYKFTKKYGRRFPYIAFGMVPFAFSMWFLFLLPGTLPRWAAIIWATVALLSYETLYTIIQTSSGALYPDKFRTDRDRKRLTIANQVLWFLGLMVGIFLPGIFFFGQSAKDGSYVLSNAAMWLAIVSLIGMSIMLPGMKETPEMIERNLKNPQKGTSFAEFISTFKTLFRNRNFMGYFAVTTGMAILQTMIITSIPFAVLYIAEQETGMALFIQMAYAGAAVIFVPLWIWLQKKYTYQQLYPYAFWIIPLALIPFIFVSNIWIFVGFAFIVGIGIGGLSLLGSRMYWDVIDQACVDEACRKEGAYASVFTFLQRFGPLLGTGIVALVQLLTNFQAGEQDEYGSYIPPASQSPEAVAGIRWYFAILPIIIASLGFLIFKLLYRLTPEKVAENQTKLKEMGI